MDPPQPSLREAMAVLLQSNFDADTKTCLVTILKLLDNLLQHPLVPKYRTINVTNPAIRSKILDRPGGYPLLLAVGFAPMPEINSRFPARNVVPTAGTLMLQHEDTSRLDHARQWLAQQAVQTLQMAVEELPVYRPPPPPVVLIGPGNGPAQDHSGQQAVTFDPYRGQRFDGLSAAVGTNLGPGGDYVSKIDLELAALQAKQAKLESLIQNPLVTENRSWTLWRPGQAVAVPTAAAATSTLANEPSDGNLLAGKIQRQVASQQQRETTPFTTAKMRQLSQLKQSGRVYSHVVLTVQFSDGHRLVGQFLPKETIQAVVQALQQDCLVEPFPLELYMTPPRRLLPLDRTLQEEGLVPAAKLYVSWKQSNSVPANGGYISPLLLEGTATATATLDSTTSLSPPSALFPTAISVTNAILSDLEKTSSQETDANPTPPADKETKKKAMTAEEKEAALLARMMGRTKK
jgi:PUB domain/UBX domain